MPLTLDVSSKREISLEEFCSLVEGCDLDDYESICSLGGAFASLLARRQLLVDAIRLELRRAIDNEGSFSGRSFVLARGHRYAVRVNIWSPPSNDPEVRQYDMHSEAYLVAHNHHFSLLTGGLHGPGYRTQLFCIEGPTVTPGALVAADVGERLDLRDLGVEQLHEGKVMFYFPSTDVHSQQHPEAFSASLNLIVFEPDSRRREQYLFDTRQGTILECTTTGPAIHVDLCELAAEVGDDANVPLLESLARRYPNPKVRRSSLRAIQRLAPSMQSKIEAIASRDHHQSVGDMLTLTNRLDQ